MIENNNPLFCDFDSGMCEIPLVKEDTTVRQDSLSTKKAVKVIYYTDPICSSCWGIEAQLRKLKLEYGHVLDFEYRMGGLLPDWSYNSGGISKPSDVAKHWDEASAYYDMPIDGDVWLEDPLPSSYPPSIAFKAAQLQDQAKALLFLRELREMVFLQKKNISKWEHIEAAALRVGLNAEQLKSDYEGQAKDLFSDDLKLGRELGVRGFPSLLFTDSTGKKEFVYGSKPYAVYENVLQKLAPAAVKNEYNKSWEQLFAKYRTLTAREFAELSGTNRSESEQVLDELTAKGKLQKQPGRNGAIWKRNTQ
ncbi:MAG: DsbA family protein [Bacteroidia bacterium]|nr:DsbA family protein [Bacteroidia bacterium]